ncbi:dienelactone hydrolase [Haloactinospora alba]|uniref:Dienelactone hydrolase n=1 Tax=Haloactinospora alba TaxID=405555 RepID=A0A543NIA6_9ACTN|nr:alpha/beta family hydrolase [Haloactinospora alba]TQN31576.1 dienelactone hydrolase [Haloactinospora alba]
MDTRHVAVETSDAALAGDMTVPAERRGIILFAHGSGSSRLSPRNRAVSEALANQGFATLLLDLLTPEEEQTDERTRELRFDTALLTRRLSDVVDWLGSAEETAGLPVGLFGASTGAAAALGTAVRRPDRVHAVVCRGGRVDLAPDGLAGVRAPVLMIAGSADEPIVRVSFQAQKELHVTNDVHLVPDATHLFEEPGALEQVAGEAITWFREYLAGPEGQARHG